MFVQRWRNLLLPGTTTWNIGKNVDFENRALWPNLLEISDTSIHSKLVITMPDAHIIGLLVRQWLSGLCEVIHVKCPQLYLWHTANTKYDMCLLFSLSQSQKSECVNPLDTKRIAKNYIFKFRFYRPQLNIWMYSWGDISSTASRQKLVK